MVCEMSRLLLTQQQRTNAAIPSCLLGPPLPTALGTSGSCRSQFQWPSRLGSFYHLQPPPLRAGVSGWVPEVVNSVLLGAGCLLIPVDTLEFRSGAELTHLLVVSDHLGSCFWTCICCHPRRVKEVAWVSHPAVPKGVNDPSGQDSLDLLRAPRSHTTGLLWSVEHLICGQSEMRCAVKVRYTHLDDLA
jgi:hypothetical protein